MRIVGMDVVDLVGEVEMFLLKIVVGLLLLAWAVQIIAAVTVAGFFGVRALASYLLARIVQPPVAVDTSAAPKMG